MAPRFYQATELSVIAMFRQLTFQGRSQPHTLMDLNNKLRRRDSVPLIVRDDYNI